MISNNNTNLNWSYRSFSSDTTAVKGLNDDDNNNNKKTSLKLRLRALCLAVFSCSSKQTKSDEGVRSQYSQWAGAVRGLFGESLGSWVYTEGPGWSPLGIADSAVCIRNTTAR